MDERLSFDQTEHENRKAFITRLVAAGWKRRDAVLEWERIQEAEADWAEIESVNQ